MKNLYFGLIILLTLLSCTGSEGDKSKNVALDPVIDKKCYLAIDGLDTARMDLETLKSGKLNGSLLITFKDSQKNDGTLVGEMKGDTLFVDYSFKAGDSKIMNKNPLVFLIKGTELKMGVGVIETTLGRSYFVRDKPINFDRGRFNFEAKDYVIK